MILSGDRDSYLSGFRNRLAEPWRGARISQIDDPLNAFCKDSEAYLAGQPGQPLSDLSFAAKDIFDVTGHVTGGGNPDWKDTHHPAERTAWAVQVLVDAGATMVGKTITDELTRGIFGENAHYGTPTNSRAPERVPGGSSSGSAAAVAGGCDQRWLEMAGVYKGGKGWQSSGKIVAARAASARRGP